MYKLKNKFIYFDAYDLPHPRLFISDSENHYKYIMEGETREAFNIVYFNKEEAEEYYEVFSEYGFFIKI